MTKYEKIYTRENCLLAFNMWEEHQTKTLKKVLDWVAPTSIFNVKESVAEVYYGTNLFPGYDAAIIAQWKKSKDFITKTMQWYAEIVEPLWPIWKANRQLKNVKELIDFYERGLDAWCGLDVSYCAPSIETLPQVDRDIAMKMREKVGAFLDDMDRIFQKTLVHIFPKLNDLSKYITFDELKMNKIPPKNILEERKKHYVYFNNQIIINTSFEDFLKQNNIEIEQITVKETDTVKGQTAMRGDVKGRVRIIMKKENIRNIQQGEILVTAMTTPDYLPAMHKAAAIITDEGGITCHAAIVARELKKPCIIGTKIATKVLKDGDLVEVDAEKGLVKKICR